MQATITRQSGVTLIEACMVLAISSIVVGLTAPSLRGLIETLPELEGHAFVLARQENLETIHQHNVVAERYGLLEEIRAELDSGRHSHHHLTMREWLESPAAG